MSYAGLFANAIAAAVRAALGNPSTNIWSDTIVQGYINTAYYTDICARFDFFNLLGTATKAIVAGASSATFDVTEATGPSGCLAIKAVSIPSIHVTLDKASPHDYVMVGGPDTTNVRGTPSRWDRLPDATGDLVLRIFPAADKAYTLRVDYRKRPLALDITADDQLTELPDEWDQILIDFACARLARSLRLHEDAQAYYIGAETSARQLSGTSEIGASDVLWLLAGGRRSTE